MPKSEKKGDATEQQQQERKDPYTILGVGRNSTEQEIKSAYRKLALKYHPDKNSDDPIASDIFKEVTHSYNILSDPDKRRKYDALGYEAVELESQELEVDLSSLGTVNTMFAALFSKLGIPIRTTVSATLLEEALNGRVTIHQLNLGQSLSRKVEKQCAHFYSVEITEQEAQMGFVCRVHSAEKSKFKLLYFEQEYNGGLNLSLQEDSAKIGKFTCAGMFFLCFPVYRFEHTNSYLQLEASKDPDAFFKKLDGFQPCEINELKPGTQVFAVYGDNFFKSANYTIEFVCAAHFSSEKEQLRNVEAKMLTKRVELSSFEGEYRQVLAQFTEMTDRYVQSMHEIDELLDSRTGVLSSFTSIPPPLKRSGSSSKIRGSFKGSKGEEEGQSREKKSRYQSKKKKWYNLHSNIEKRKPC